MKLLYIPLFPANLAYWLIYLHNHFSVVHHDSCSELLSFFGLEIITCVIRRFIFLQDARKRFDKASLVYDQVWFKNSICSLNNLTINKISFSLLFSCYVTHSCYNLEGQIELYHLSGHWFISHRWKFVDIF